MEWYLKAWRDFLKFDGRSRRTEFWMFVLINYGVSAVLYFVESMFGSPGILGSLYSLAVTIPAIAVGIRRLHDTGRPGLWMLIGLVPLIGLVLLYFMALDSEPGSNKYGSNPKGA